MSKCYSAQDSTLGPPLILHLLSGKLHQGLCVLILEYSKSYLLTSPGPSTHQESLLWRTRESSCFLPYSSIVLHTGAQGMLKHISGQVAAVLTISPDSYSPSLRIKSDVLSGPQQPPDWSHLSSTTVHCCPPPELPSSYWNIRPAPAVALTITLPATMRLFPLVSAHNVTFHCCRQTSVVYPSLSLLTSCFLFLHSSQSHHVCKFLLI